MYHLPLSIVRPLLSKAAKEFILVTIICTGVTTLIDRLVDRLLPVDRAPLVKLYNIIPPREEEKKDEGCHCEECENMRREGESPSTEIT